MSDTELSDRLDGVFTAEQALAAERLSLIREIDARDVARAQGATSLTEWLVGRYRITGSAARQMVELALALEKTCEVTAKALAAGLVNESQARVIGKAVTDLAQFGADVQADAEALMLGEHFTALEPATLRKAAESVLECVAPELAEERQREALEKAEKIASRDRSLHWSPFHDGTGRERLSGIFGAEAAATIKAAMEPLSLPAGQNDDRTATQRRADALGDVCRLALATNDLPANGGDATKVVVTMDFHALAAGVGAGRLDNGEVIAPEAVRRLACCAGIIPAVLNTRHEPIDLGRERRLFTGAARRALVLRDRGCAFPGCDRPPKWTEGHHVKHWSRGGGTDLANGVLLCGHHHRLVHKGEWIVRVADDGLPEFIPPFWLDPLQSPRRNHFHRRH